MKKALISSILVIALCFSVIAGSTFALFTAESGVNVAITSAKVAFKATIVKESLATTSLGVAQTAGEFANGGTAAFDAKDDLVLTNVTPGDKATFTIQVENTSTVDVQYRVKWAVDGELYEALVATADGVAIANSTSDWALWTVAEADTKTIAVSVEMPMDVGDEYQDKSASVSFMVEAVQGNAIVENVRSAEELALALQMGNTAKLASDVTLTESQKITIADDTVAVIDLNGFTLSGSSAEDAGALIVNNGTLSIIGSNDAKITNTTANGDAVVENFGELVIEDVTIVGAPIADGSYPQYAVYSKGGSVTINEGTTIISDRGALRVKDSEAVINGGTFAVTDAANSRTLTCHTIYAQSGSTLTINDGTFENHYTGVSGASVVCPAGGSITINGGDFRDDVDSTADFNNTANIQNYMGYGVPVNVYGGTFDDNTVNTNVAAGYEALFDAKTGIYTVAKEGNELQENANGEMIVVPEGTDTIVESVEGKTAQEALNEAVKSGEIVYIAEPGVYEFPSSLGSTDGATIVGAEGVVFEDTLSGGLTNTTIKNVKIKASNAQRWSYPHGTLVFEGCTFEATGIYAVHYDGGIDNANITYKNCTFIGWVAIGSGAEHITFDGCEIYGNGTYGVIRVYSPATIKNCTFDVSAVNTTDVYQDGIHAVDCNIDLSNNTNVNGDMTALYNISGTGTLTEGNTVYVSTQPGMQKAVNEAVDGTVVTMLNRISGDVTVTQKPDVKFTIDGNGNTFAGVITVDGRSSAYATAGLTIQNINFSANFVSADACIRLGVSGDNDTRYTSNVTVIGCTFDVPDVVGIKSYTGGDKNLQVINCTATERAHSLGQLTGVDDVLIQGCKIYSVRGISFNSSTDVTVDDCIIDVEKYAVRFGAGSAADERAESYKITGCTLISENGDGDAAIVLRGTAAKSTLTIENTTITAGVEITNSAVDATVVR